MADDMRICDCSSDVCSSVLLLRRYRLVDDGQNLGVAMVIRHQSGLEYGNARRERLWSVADRYLGLDSQKAELFRRGQPALRPFAVRHLLPRTLHDAQRVKAYEHCDGFDDGEGKSGGCG